MQLILDSNGLSLTKRNQSFYVSHKKLGRRLISPHRVTSIAVVADCMISTAALRLAAKHGIPVHFCTRTGKAEAAVYAAGYGSIATIRRQQTLVAETPTATELVAAWFSLKAAGQIAILQQRERVTNQSYGTAIDFLQRQAEKMPSKSKQPLAKVRGTFLGMEGSAGRQYWSALAATLPEAWKFAGRSRQPATDPFNAVLNYYYGMTYNVVENAVRGVGLDPYLGFFHTDAYQRPTLVYDLIEPFRPWIDGLLVALIDEKPIITAKHFQKKDNGIWLSKTGRRFYIPKYNDYLQEKIDWRDYRTTRKNHIHRFCGQLANYLKEWKPST